MYIISDEIHQDLVFGENKHIPSLSIGEYNDIMVSIVAASKTFNIAGAQNSMVIIPDEKLQEKWDTYVKGNRVLGGNAFGYVAAQAAYTGGNEWLTLVLDQIEENYQLSESRTCGKTSGGGCDSAGRNVSLLDQSGSICKCRWDERSDPEEVPSGR